MQLEGAVAQLLPTDVVQNTQVQYMRPNALVLLPTVELAAQTDLVLRQLSMSQKKKKRYQNNMGCLQFVMQQAQGLDIETTLVVSSKARGLSTSDVIVATPGRFGQAKQTTKKQK